MLSLIVRYFSTRSKDAGRVEGRLQGLDVQHVKSISRYNVNVSPLNQNTLSNPYLTLVTHSPNKTESESQTTAKVSDLYKRIERLRAHKIDASATLKK
jgi:hypothetical protein